MWDFSRLRRIHRELAVFHQAPFPWQTVNIAKKKLARQSGCDWSASLGRKNRAQRRGKVHLHSASRGQQIGSPAQIFSGLTIIRDAGNRIGWNRAAYPECDALARLLQKLLQKERHPNAWMRHAYQLKSKAIASAEIHGKSCGARSSDQSGGRVAPLRISNRALRQLPVRHLASWKHRQHSPLLEPLDGSPESTTIPFGGTHRMKRIYKDARLLEFRHALQKKIRHHLYVRPN